MKVSKALTWDDLANLYDKANSGRPARTLPMEKIYDWAVQRDEFWVNPDEDTIHRRETNEEKT